MTSRPSTRVGAIIVGATVLMAGCRAQRTAPVPMDAPAASPAAAVSAREQPLVDAAAGANGTDSRPDEAAPTTMPPRQGRPFDPGAAQDPGGDIVPEPPPADLPPPDERRTLPPPEKVPPELAPPEMLE